MTGPEHYREAERLLILAHRFTYGDHDDPVAGAALATEAQAHATLALAAATAIQPSRFGAARPEWTGWAEVAGHRETADEAAEPTYPEPGSAIPDEPGYVVGGCGHRVAGSEWRSGFKTCERCPSSADREVAS